MTPKATDKLDKTAAYDAMDEMDRTLSVDGALERMTGSSIAPMLYEFKQGSEIIRGLTAEGYKAIAAHAGISCEHKVERVISPTVLQCPSCAGTGRLRIEPTEGEPETLTCPLCNGTGQIVGKELRLLVTATATTTNSAGQTVSQTASDSELVLTDGGPKAKFQARSLGTCMKRNAMRDLMGGLAKTVEEKMREYQKAGSVYVLDGGAPAEAAPAPTPEATTTTAPDPAPEVTVLVGTERAADFIERVKAITNTEGLPEYARERISAQWAEFTEAQYRGHGLLQDVPEDVLPNCEIFLTQVGKYVEKQLGAADEDDPFADG